MSLKENSFFWNSQITVVQDFVKKKKLFSARYGGYTCSPSTWETQHKEAQKFEASQDHIASFYPGMGLGSKIRNWFLAGHGGTHLSTQEAGGSQTRSPELYNKFVASLGYLRPCLEKLKGLKKEIGKAHA